MLDLTAIYASYTTATGAPPLDPRLMLKLMFYAYSSGVTSSREIERRCQVDVAFRRLSANTVKRPGIGDCFDVSPAPGRFS